MVIYGSERHLKFVSKLTDAVVFIVQCVNEIETGRLAPLTEDACLHERGKVGSSVGRAGGARVIAAHPRQPGIDDIISDQFLTEEYEPELVVPL